MAELDRLAAYTDHDEEPLLDWKPTPWQRWGNWRGDILITFLDFLALTGIVLVIMLGVCL